MNVKICWSLPEDIVSAPSVNIFKGRFDKHCTAHLGYCIDNDYVSTLEDVETTGLLAYMDWQKKKKTMMLKKKAVHQVTSAWQQIF